jgi:branched-chain amino acid transport system substrate-binding protein
MRFKPLAAVAGVAIAAMAMSLAPNVVYAQSRAHNATVNKKVCHPIVIGAAIAKTGFMVSFDTPDMNGFKLEMNQINAGGGIDCRKLKLIEANTNSTTAGAKQAATDLIAKGAQILLVTANYDVGAPAGLVAQAHGILNISIGAASPLYGVQGVGNLAFMVAPATYLEGATMATFSKQQGWTRAIILCDVSLDYSAQMCTGYKDEGTKLGLHMTEITFENSDASIASQVAAIKSSNAQVIALCSYTPGGATAMRQVRAGGVSLPTLSGIGMAGTYWLTSVPHLSNYYTMSSASIYGDDPNPEVNTFVKEYVKAYGGLPQTDAAVGGYTAGQMIDIAVQEAGGVTKGSVLAGLLEKFKNVPLLSGPTTFTKTLHIPASRPLVVIKYTNGKPAYLETLPVKGPVNFHL